MLLERGDALGSLLALGPDLERLAAEPGGVAVGVDGCAIGDRLAQRIQRAARVAGGEPVPGDLARVAAGPLQLVGDRAVQRAAAQPRHVLVDGVAHERVAERGARPAVVSTSSPHASSSPTAVLAGQAGDEGEIHPRARDRGGLGGGATAAR